MDGTYIMIQALQKQDPHITITKASTASFYHGYLEHRVRSLRFYCHSRLTTVVLDLPSAEWRSPHDSDVFKQLGQKRLIG